MKTLKNSLWAFVAITLFAACSDDKTDTLGPQEDPDNYGVYFPDQTSPTEVEVDPADTPEVTYKVRRTKYLDAITVPVEIVTSEEGILEIEPITFGPGEQETEFKVSFPNAVEGTTYTCDILVKDPHYISLYGPRATGLSFSVIRAGWQRVKAADGSEAKGKWRDDLMGNLYSLSSSSFNPYPEVEIEMFERTDIPGYYRMKVYTEEMVTAFAGGLVNYTGRDVYTIVDARDPDKVFIPYQSTGLTLVTADGELKIASSVAENFMMDESTGEYGTLKDGVITFPASSVLLEVEKTSGAFYYGNRNGMLRILLPGVVVADYTVSLSASAPANGVVKVAATLTDDVKKLRFSVFEGALDDGQASLAAQDMDASKTSDGEITASGTIKIENRQTGKYTLVGCVYDAEGVMRDYVFVSFGYIAQGDDKPVVLTMGLEATQEFAGQGITPDNSAKFYAYGENIESVVYGLFRTDRLGSQDSNALLNAQGKKFTAEQLEALNNGGFSTMIAGLNGASDYTMLLRADNGYVSKLFQTTYRTTGTYNPAMDSFSYSDFLPTSQQPSLNYLKATTWNYYAIDLVGSDATRHKIGQVTMEANTEQSTSSLQILNIKGLSGIEFDEGGAMFGMYMPTASMFDSYNGVVALYADKTYTTGTYKGQDAFMGFVPEGNNNSIYFGYGMFMGAVADGYLYCVPSPVGLEENLTFSYFFTGSSSDVYSLMTEMLLVDPAKDLGTGLSSAAMERIAALRKQAMASFQPRNYVELPEFSGAAAGFNPAMGAQLPINCASTLGAASAPRLKRAAARITVEPTATAGAATTFQKVGVRKTDK